MLITTAIYIIFICINKTSSRPTSPQSEKCRDCYPSDGGVVSFQYKNARFQASDPPCCDDGVNNRMISLLSNAKDDKRQDSDNNNNNDENENNNNDNNDNNSNINKSNNNNDDSSVSNAVKLLNIPRPPKDTITNGENGPITKLIDLLTLFRLTQLKELQKYLSESVASVEVKPGEGGQRHENAAQRFKMERQPESSDLRNKSVDAIEHIFKSLVSNKQVQRFAFFFFFSPGANILAKISNFFPRLLLISTSIFSAKQ